ncbi:MAG: hypothetical protein ACRD0W_00605 [Acidimicrobiales bacterium]
MAAEDQVLPLRIIVAPALNIRPGDKVLINFGVRAEAYGQEWSDVLEQLRELFPDVEFTALFNAEQIIVQPADVER